MRLFPLGRVPRAAAAARREKERWMTRLGSSREKERDGDIYVFFARSMCVCVCVGCRRRQRRLFVYVFLGRDFGTRFYLFFLFVDCGIRIFIEKWVELRGIGFFFSNVGVIQEINLEFWCGRVFRDYIYSRNLNFRSLIAEHYFSEIAKLYYLQFHLKRNN